MVASLPQPVPGPALLLGLEVFRTLFAYRRRVPSAVPISPLPGISLAGFASRHVAEWFHRSPEKRCCQSQFLMIGRVVYTKRSF